MDIGISREDMETHKTVGPPDVALEVLQDTILLLVALHTLHETMGHAEQSFHHDCQDNSIRMLDDAKRPSISDIQYIRSVGFLQHNCRTRFQYNFLVPFQ